MAITLQPARRDQADIQSAEARQNRGPGERHNAPMDQGGKDRSSCFTRDSAFDRLRCEQDSREKPNQYAHEHGEYQTERWPKCRRRG